MQGTESGGFLLVLDLYQYNYELFYNGFIEVRLLKSLCTACARSNVLSCLSLRASRAMATHLPCKLFIYLEMSTRLMWLQTVYLYNRMVQRSSRKVSIQIFGCLVFMLQLTSYKEREAPLDYKPSLHASEDASRGRPNHAGWVNKVRQG